MLILPRRRLTAARNEFPPTVVVSRECRQRISRGEWRLRRPGNLRWIVKQHNLGAVKPAIVELPRRDLVAAICGQAPIVVLQPAQRSREPPGDRDRVLLQITAKISGILAVRSVPLEVQGMVIPSHQPKW